MTEVDQIGGCRSTRSWISRSCSGRRTLADLAGLSTHGLLGGAPAGAAPTAAGRALRAEVEAHTDALAAAPWTAVGADRAERLVALAAPLVAAIMTGHGFLPVNPTDLRPLVQLGPVGSVAVGPRRRRARRASWLNRARMNSVSRPDPRSPTKTAALPSAMAGAVDLAALKARSEAAARPRPVAAQRVGPDGSLGGGSGFVIDVTEQTFQADVLERSLQVPVIVDLWAEWCEPCKQLSPVLERLAEAGNGAWILAKVDVDANQRIAQAFQAQSIPMVVAVVAGQPVDAFNGALPEPQVRQWISSLLDALRDRMPAIADAEAGAAGGVPEPVEEPEDPRFTAAEDALERGDWDEAEAAYQRILDVEPANEQAVAALAQVRFLVRAEKVDPEAVARADAAPDDVDAQLVAADAELAGDGVEEAFARLVATAGRTFGDDRDRVRAHLIGLFELFAPDDPRVTAARRALARVLF